MQLIALCTFFSLAAMDKPIGPLTEHGFSTNLDDNIQLLSPEIQLSIAKFAGIQLEDYYFPRASGLQGIRMAVEEIHDCARGCPHQVRHAYYRPIRQAVEIYLNPILPDLNDYNIEKMTARASKAIAFSLDPIIAPLTLTQFSQRYAWSTWMALVATQGVKALYKHFDSLNDQLERDRHEAEKRRKMLRSLR